MIRGLFGINDQRFVRDHCHEEPGFFFVGNDGKQLTLRGIVNTLTDLDAEHTLLEPGPVAERLARWGGHSPRRAGAQELSRMGMSLILIQKVGRWGSCVIATYVADVPLEAIGFGRGLPAALRFNDAEASLVQFTKTLKSLSASVSKIVRRQKLLRLLVTSRSVPVRVIVLARHSSLRRSTRATTASAGPPLKWPS